MTWEMYLISLYFELSSISEEIEAQRNRISNHSKPSFTDVELLTVYFFGVLKRHYSQHKDIYNFTNDHLRSWFPHLPSYAAFNRRLNDLHGTFKWLSERNIAQIVEKQDIFGQKLTLLVDSLPIMLAKGKRCGQAKVALEIANKGFCSTKSVYYHGVKLHGLAESKFESLPLFQAIAITDAAQHDNKAFKDLLAPLVYGCDIYADKAYCDQTHAKQLLEEQGVTLVAIEKRKKRQKELTLFQEVNNYNTSCVRQPVESLFNWLIEKTNIQNAAKCRATTGLLTHIFAKIAAAALFLNLFNY